MGIYEELQARGLVAQVTNEEKVREMLNNGKATFYIGFDPTADSLHVGHFMALCLMRRLQKAGNRPIALLGGGTGMIGDPSGKSEMRKALTKETIEHNIECFKKQMSRFIEFGEDKALMVNNADWLLNLNYVELLREVGACFSVNNMLRAECYKQRMANGLSFLEFNYMIMQAYDFYTLYQRYGCNFQFGGDDQWSNMLAGRELIRKKIGGDTEDKAESMTITLLLNSQGQDFYQYWRNVDDSDVIKCLKMLTDVSLEEIAEMETWKDSQLNKAKEILAFELTKLVHGEDEANKAQETARSLFGRGRAVANMPTTVVSADEFADGSIGLIKLLVLSGIASSNGDARRQITKDKCISVNDEKVLDANAVYTAEQLAGEGLVLKKGKKVYHRVHL